MKNPMWVLSWTIEYEEPQGSQHVDHFIVREEYEDVKNTYDGLADRVDRHNLMFGNRGSLYCASISRVVEATEPHWEDQGDE